MDIHLFRKFNFGYSENNGRRFSDSKRNKFEIENAAKLGLNLCDKYCCKENAEVIKRLLNPIKVEETWRRLSKISKIFAPS